MELSCLKALVLFNDDNDGLKNVRQVEQVTVTVHLHIVHICTRRKTHHHFHSAWWFGGPLAVFLLYSSLLNPFLCLGEVGLI